MFEGPGKWDRTRGLGTLWITRWKQVSGTSRGGVADGSRFCGTAECLTLGRAASGRARCGGKGRIHRKGPVGGGGRQGVRRTLGPGRERNTGGSDNGRGAGGGG